MHCKAFTSELGKEENPACKTDLDWIKNTNKRILQFVGVVSVATR